MSKLNRSLLTLLLSLFIFGCGQSGPLYVSGNPSTVQPQAEESAEEDEQDESGEADQQ